MSTAVAGLEHLLDASVLVKLLLLLALLYFRKTSTMCYTLACTQSKEAGGCVYAWYMMQSIMLEELCHVGDGSSAG